MMKIDSPFFIVGGAMTRREVLIALLCAICLTVLPGCSDDELVVGGENGPVSHNERALVLSVDEKSQTAEVRILERPDDLTLTWGTHPASAEGTADFSEWGSSGLPEVGDDVILKWIGKRGLSYVTDSTNLCNDYTRNLLRNRILPDLTAGVNHQAARHILQAGLICREADSYIRQEAGTFLREEGRLQEGGIALPRKLLKEKPQIFRRYVIIEALDRLGVPLKDFAERNLADLDKALFSGKGFHLDLPNGARADNLPELTVISFK